LTTGALLPRKGKSRAPKTQLKLNLGANRHPEPGFVNVDRFRFPGIDCVVDLEGPWPWASDSVDFIQANDLVEHLRDPIHTMNEAWRVLRVGGIFHILVPSTDGRGAFQDPTHVSFWNPNSFFYYSVREVKDENGGPPRLESHPFRRIYAPYLIKCAYRIALGISDPSTDGVIYILAKCEKVPDPGDCEAPS